MILERGDRREMGRYEDGRWGGLFGLRIGIMIDDFQMVGIWAVCMERLKREVIASTALGPRCFTCIFATPSGPRALEDEMLRRMFRVWSGVNRGVGFGGRRNFAIARLDRRLDLWSGKLEMEA